MALGVVPGLMFLATKVVPTAIMIMKKLADEGAQTAQTAVDGASTPTKTPAKAAKPSPEAAIPPGSAMRTPVAAKAGGGDKMFTPYVSSEGVKQRRPAAMMYPGRSD